MEPTRTTPPTLRSIERELIDREPIFHRPELGNNRSAFEAMTADDFWETGASGRRYSRQYVLDTLERRHALPHEDPWETSDFYCQEIAPQNYLLTYTLRQGARLTRRATLWRRAERGWLVVYHQGTPVDANGGSPHDA